MIKETETKGTIVFFATFLSLVSFQLGGAAPPPGYAYVRNPDVSIRSLATVAYTILYVVWLNCSVALGWN